MGAGSAGSIRVSAGAGTGSPTLTLPASAVRMATPQLLSQVSLAIACTHIGSLLFQVSDSRNLIKEQTNLIKLSPQNKPIATEKNAIVSE